MKKSSLAFALIVLCICISSSALAFDLYGCWKSEQRYPLNVLKFDNENYYYGPYSLSAKYTEKGDEQLVIFNIDSEIRLKKIDENTIKATFPDPSLPQDIVYKRISEEERATLIMKKR